MRQRKSSKTKINKPKHAMCVTCCRDIDGFNVKDFVSEAVKGYSCI